MEEKIKAILARIEASNLEEQDKVQLYAVISESLKASIWPTLVSRMPKDKLEVLVKNPGKATVESYLELIEEATKDDKVLDDVNAVLNNLVNEIDTVLTEEKI
mgnify:FL=1